MNNYTAYRRDRGSPGGGVIILVKNDLISEEFLDDTWRDTETVSCVLSIGVNRILLSCMYRPPAQPIDFVYNNNVRKSLRQMSRLNFEQVLVCGDFNYKEIDWVNHHVTGSELSEQQKFYDAVGDTFFHQHVTEFTRARGTDEPSLLDLIMSNKELEVENIRYCAPVGTSDHSVIAFDFLVEGIIPDEESVTKTNYVKGEYGKMREELAKVNWYALMEGKSITEMWDIFLDKYKDLVNRYVPKLQFSTRRNKSDPKWLTRYAKSKIDQKERAWERYRKRKTRVRYEYYKTSRNIATNAVRYAKASFEKDIAKNIKKNKRAFYAYARSKTTIKEGVSRIRKSDGTLSTNNQESSTALNEAFQSTFTIEPPGPIPEVTNQYVGESLQDISFTVEEVKEYIGDLKEFSAPGTDGIHPKVLKECVDSFALPLWMIFKKSLENGQLPREWKDGVVTPIFKKGSKVDPLNYRPVSLTSVPCKLFEKIITKRIKEHLEVNDILSKVQYGFRSKHLA